jgi:hypothetical protein
VRTYSSHAPRRILLTFAAALLALLVLPSLATASGRPSRYLIKGVPEIGQLDYTGCGAAAMQMMMDYWGPRVDQREIVDVIRSMSRGSSLPDAARAAQFSFKSACQSDAYPGYQPFHGYRERSLGYGGFFYASTTSWFEQLKNIVAQGYPVQVLTDWTPTESGPHYRVVVGYDDVKKVVYLNDPWPYGPWLVQYKKPGFSGWTWPYADFLKVWALPTDDWGLAGYFYGAVVAAPWRVVVTAPRTVEEGATFTVTVRATYRCPAPFGRGPSATFPIFTATKCTDFLLLPKGFKLVGLPTRQLGSGTLAAGHVSVALKYRVTAPNRDVSVWLKAKASGKVSGSCPKWGDVYWNAAYSYADVIGGWGLTHLVVK